MIQKMVSGALSALTGAIKVVLLFGVLVGLVIWARNDPEAWKQLMAKVAGAGVMLVTQVADLVIGLLDKAGS
ncbi:MAG TPA: hypothetical protein VMU51_10840 [Mycobacteriales bacterium]|nr:hypothetical protein [Mycobacteriales bacterium]